MYIGVHVPKSYRPRRRRHKRKTNHKEKRDRAEQSAEVYKSDTENVDESCTSILKPLSECCSKQTWHLLKAELHLNEVSVSFSRIMKLSMQVVSADSWVEWEPARTEAHGKTLHTNLKMTAEWLYVCKVTTKRGFIFHTGD